MRASPTTSPPASSTAPWWARPLSCRDSLTGEVHGDGKLVAAAGWMLREEYGVEAADALVWGALTLMTPDSSLYDFSRALLSTAETPGDISWSLLLREGEPVGFTSGVFLPEPTVVDLSTDVYTTESQTIELDPALFTPGETLFALVKSENCPNSYMTITGAQPLPEPDDGGGDDGGGEDGGDDGGDGDDGGSGGGTDSGTDSTSGAAGDDSDTDKGGCTTVGLLEPGLVWLAVCAVGARRRRDPSA